MSAAYIVNIMACMAIFAWATWCAMDHRVKDGVLGKIMFSAAALAALGVLMGPQTGYHGPRTAEVTLNVAMAALGARHVTMKYLWPRVVRFMRCRCQKGLQK